MPLLDLTVSTPFGCPGRLGILVANANFGVFIPHSEFPLRLD
ncbi:hypothetical protein D1BOALGB6SA_7142 [Olavius sp. associated proteobacterium Delta 1]|nr:hypothetical protein D1BOALGB6SA_7142 [Olavius sp. associated proteobacterium Delta 1]